MTISELQSEGCISKFRICLLNQIWLNCVAKVTYSCVVAMKNHNHCICPVLRRAALISHTILPSFMHPVWSPSSLPLPFCSRFSPSNYLCPLHHAALFTVWKCPKLPASTYYKMHLSGSCIRVSFCLPQCVVGEWVKEGLKGKDRRGERTGQDGGEFESHCPCVAWWCELLNPGFMQNNLEGVLH